VHGGRSVQAAFERQVARDLKSQRIDLIGPCVIRLKLCHSFGERVDLHTIRRYRHQLGFPRYISCCLLLSAFQDWAINIQRAPGPRVRMKTHLEDLAVAKIE
jgi:hypothetical protein